jgi:hypothetical protein
MNIPEFLEWMIHSGLSVYDNEGWNEGVPVPVKEPMGDLEVRDLFRQFTKWQDSIRNANASCSNPFSGQKHILDTYVPGPHDPIEEGYG